MQHYQKEASLLIKLSTPVLLASIAQTGMSFIDTVMAGGVSTTDLAAVALASSIWQPTILLGIGILMALIPIIAQLNGSGRQNKMPNNVQQGIYLAILLTIPVILILLQTESILNWKGDVNQEMTDKTVGYMNAMLFAAPAFLLFQALRSFTDGLSFTKPAMILGLLGLLLNIPLNWAFVYGKFGLPALGAVGCGVATAIVYWFMFLAMLLYIIRSKRFERIGLFKQYYTPHKESILRILKLGWPVGAAIFCEVSLFAITALLLAPLGEDIVAAHQIAISFSSLIFMLPMSIGAAVSIRVGHFIGEGKTEGAKVASNVGLLFGLSTAIVTATFTIVFREDIAAMYNATDTVIQIALPLLLIAGIYQCTDAIQVIAAGALRGYKDTKSIFTCTVISYWMVGMPVGYSLAMTTLFTSEPLGAAGFWFGFIAGLSTAALLLGLRLSWLYKRSDEDLLQFSNR